MNFTQLRRRVERGEALVEGRIRQAGACQERLRRDWRQAWTPLRIVLAGLATGFIAGRAEPEKLLQKIGTVSGPRTLQLVTSVAGLVGSVQAAIAAMTAKEAADTADRAAADTPDPSAGPPPPQAAAADPRAGAPDPEAAPARHQDRRRPDPRWEQQPSPAEAATDVSER